MPFVSKTFVFETSSRGDYTVIVDGSGRFFLAGTGGPYSYFAALSRLGRAFSALMASS
jgi:hypothetical protein